MAAGYSSRFVHAVRSANPRILGVKFGLYCIRADIPVADVAEYFGVSRMTVYNWFKGITRMPEDYRPTVDTLISEKES